MDYRDKKVSPGVKFANMDLIGIPHRLTIGDRGLKDGVIEYQARRTGTRKDVPQNEVVSFISELFSGTQ